MIIKICDDDGTVIHTMYDNGVGDVNHRKPDHACKGVVNIRPDGMAAIISGQCDQINPYLRTLRGRTVRALFFEE